MTNNNAFKKLVRERMKETNETFMQAADALMQGKPAVKKVETKKPAQQLKYIDFDTIVTSEYTRNFLLEEIFTLSSPTLIIAGDANSGKTSFLASYFRKLAESKKVHIKPFGLYDYQMEDTSPHEDLYRSVEILDSVHGKSANLTMGQDTQPIKHIVPALNKAFNDNIEAFGYDEGKVDRPNNSWYPINSFPNPRVIHGLGFEYLDNNRNGFIETLSHEERNFLFATTYYTPDTSTAEEIVKSIKKYIDQKNTGKDVRKSIELVKTIDAVVHITKKSKISGPEFSIDFAQV